MRTKNKTGYGRLWTEEEFILSLDLYYRTEPRERDANNREVIRMAHLTNRTPASIVYRLGNYSAIDPDAKVKGFDNGGKTVKEMFYKHSSNKAFLTKRAEKIRVKYRKKAKLHAGGIKGFIDNFNDYWSSRGTLEKECEDIHQKFLNKWSADRLNEILELDNYVMGHGDTDNFCYWLERKTEILGSIRGARSIQFKVYYSKKIGGYKWIKSFKSAQDAFDKTKKEIVNLLNAAEAGDLDSIKDNKHFKSSHMLRGKLLYLYYPEKFLNIFSEDDVNFYLNRLGLEYDSKEHILDKQVKLLWYKESSDEMKRWSILKYGYFLWTKFTPPLKTNRKVEDEVLREEGQYALPEVEFSEISLIGFEEIVTRERKILGKGKKRKYKPNYIAESIRNQKLGDQGEKIVMLYEQEILTENNRNDLSKKVKRVSLEDDSLGYDIRSFTPEGKEKLIEVKATRSGIDANTPFYLTENERKTMNNNAGKYFLYRVFAANTTSPKLLIIDGKLLNDNFVIKAKLWEVSVS